MATSRRSLHVIKGRTQKTVLLPARAASVEVRGVPAGIKALQIVGFSTLVAGGTTVLLAGLGASSCSAYSSNLPSSAAMVEHCRATAMPWLIGGSVVALVGASIMTPALLAKDRVVVREGPASTRVLEAPQFLGLGIARLPRGALVGATFAL